MAEKICASCGATLKFLNTPLFGDKTICTSCTLKNAKEKSNIVMSEKKPEVVVIPTDSNTHSNRTNKIFDDEYFQLSGVIFPETTDNILKHLDTIRTKKEWESLGYSVRESFKRKGRSYSFFLVYKPDQKEQEAIISGKKHVDNTAHLIYEYIKRGFSYDDFIFVSDDVKYFCDAKLSNDKGNKSDALSKIQKAIELKPYEKKYYDLFFKIRLELGDISAIVEEIDFNKNEIPSLIHSGRANSLFKIYIDHKNYQKAILFIDIINSIVEANLKSERFKNSPQDPFWYNNKRNQFNDTLFKAFEAKRVSDITELHSYTEDLEKLFEKIKSVETTPNLPFWERVADSFVTWGENDKAKNYYNFILSHISEGSKPKVEKKINDRLTLLKG